EIVVFHQLTRDEIVQMVELLIGRVETQLAERDMGIELTQKAKDLLAQRGFDPVLGARPLRRTIQREIEDQLSEKILYGEIGAGESKDNAKATFTFSPRPKPLPEGTFEDSLDDTEVRENEVDDAEVDSVVPDSLPEEPVSSSNDDGNNPPPAGAGAPSGQ